MIFICFWYSLEGPQWGPSNEYQKYMFLQEVRKNVNFRASKLWLDKRILTIYLLATTIDTAAGTIKSIYSPSCRVSKALCTRQPGEKVAIYPANDYGTDNPKPNIAGWIMPNSHGHRGNNHFVICLHKTREDVLSHILLEILKLFLRIPGWFERNFKIYFYFKKYFNIYRQVKKMLCSNIWKYINTFTLAFLLLNTTCPVLANSADPDQLASEEAKWSGSALFVIKYVNFYQNPDQVIWLAGN